MLPYRGPFMPMRHAAGIRVKWEQDAQRFSAQNDRKLKPIGAGQKQQINERKRSARKFARKSFHTKRESFKA